MNIILLWILFVLCIVFSAFFASSETVYSMVNQLRLKKDAEKGSKSSALALKHAENFSATNSSILLGTNLAHIASSTIGALIANYYFPVNADLIGTVAVFFILLVIGEIFPKVLGGSYSYMWSKAYAYVIRVVKWIFFPITWPINKLASVLFKIHEDIDDSTDEEEQVSDDELMEMVDAIEDEGFIDESQSELLKSAINFTDCSAMQIMTPRVDIFAFDIDDDISELTSDADIFTHSRIPVYQDSLDNIIGVVRTMDILKLMNEGNKKIDIRSLMISPFYVPESKQISAILDDFKDRNRHIAIVKDEYGGTAGLITLEDIVEELVGNIWDEMDVVEEDYSQKTENEYLVEGSMNLEDFFNLVELDIEDYEGESVTVNGFVTEKIEEFPKVGDNFDYENLHFEILSADEFTAESIKVTRVKPLEDD